MDFTQPFSLPFRVVPDIYGPSKHSLNVLLSEMQSCTSIFICVANGSLDVAFCHLSAWSACRRIDCIISSFRPFQTPHAKQSSPYLSFYLTLSFCAFQFIAFPFNIQFVLLTHKKQREKKSFFPLL